MEDLRGKVAVITGGASGIGLATARAFAREGVKLVLADIEERVLSAVVAGLAHEGAEVIGVRTDVGSKASVEDLAETTWKQWGRADIVFNNAGVAAAGATHRATHADWEWSIRVNVWGPIHGIEVFVPRMVEQGEGGHMLFTSSFAGLVPNRDLGPYCMSKFAVVGMAECLARDVKEHGIGVSILLPMRVASNIYSSTRNRPADLGGAIETPFTQEQKDSMSGRELAVEPVADLVVAAIRRGDLYVHTHAEARESVRRRWQRLDAAFEHAL
jgi:NAD(P)-dependent dehydrogenase (short-subunit alcohol dehydrogenase family)